MRVVIHCGGLYRLRHIPTIYAKRQRSRNPITIFICFFCLADPGTQVSAGTAGSCMTCVGIEILSAEESYFISTEASHRSQRSSNALTSCRLNLVATILCPNELSRRASHFLNIEAGHGWSGISIAI